MLKRSATPGVSLANLVPYSSSISVPVAPDRSRLSSATESMPDRVVIRSPTRSPTWASVTVRLPRLVTVPDTVTVSPSRGGGAERVDGHADAARVGGGPRPLPRLGVRGTGGGDLHQTGQQGRPGQQRQRAPYPAAGR
ncbi:hypothetical protein SFUMM280S_10901 [Streptomyces fumanus]